jgi:SnoaL-like domain
MAKTRELLPTTEALMKALLLPLTVAAFLTLQGTAEAVQCEDPMDPEWLTPGVNPPIPPTPADRLAIIDVISHYNWARDDKVSKGFQDLFTTNVVFEACTDGGNVQVAKRTGPGDVSSYLGNLTAFLNQHNLKTRHITDNTILNVVNQDTVEGKTTVLVTLQNAYSEIPEVDYTATLKAEFKRVSGGWRFGKLTILVDSPVPPPSGARGR